MERSAIRGRRHRRPGDRRRGFDRGPGPGTGAARDRRGGRHPVRRRRRGRLDAGRASGGRGPLPGREDEEGAEILRGTQKPVLVAANKADNEKRELEAAEFHLMGWEETHAVSASHGRGVADLLDTVVWALPPETDAERERKRREDEAEAWARDVSAGRLEPFVVGDTDDDGTDDEDETDVGGEEASARWDALM